MHDYKLLFHVHLSRFGDILIWIDYRLYRKHRSKFTKSFHIWHSDPYMNRLRPSRVYVRCHGGQETIFENEIDCEGRNRYCNTYFVSPLLKNGREY
jgi:hypothetical protein